MSYIEKPDGCILMGGLKKQKIATPQSGGEKGKEIKIVTKHIVTVADIVKNTRALRLLYIISLAENGISERALQRLVYSIEKETGLKLGYNFTLLGDQPVSRELLNDLTSLKYTGLVEVSLKNRKLVVTGSGREVIDKSTSLIQSDIEVLKRTYTEIWPKIAPVDVEASLKATRR